MMTSDSFVTEQFNDPPVVSEGLPRCTLSRTQFVYLLAIVESVGDFLAASASIAVPFVVWFAMHHVTWVPLRQIALLSASAGLAAAVISRSDHTVWLSSDARSVEATARAIRACGKTCLFLLPIAFLLKLHLSVPALLSGFVIMPLVLVLERQAILRAVHRLHRNHHGVERVVIYGVGRNSLRMVAVMQQSHRQAYLPVAMLEERADTEISDTDATQTSRSQAMILHGLAINADILRSLHCDLLLLPERLSSRQMQRLHSAATEAEVRLAYARLEDDAIEMFDASDVIDDDDLPMLPMEPSSTRWIYAFCKRLMDIAVSSLLLVLLLPLFLLIALCICITSQGPAIFVQERVGRNGAHFRMYKFRSMQSSAARYDRSPSTAHDPRITAIGRILRRTSLDELPQLLNVFLGQMSLVGPRPEMPFLVRNYTAHQRQRLHVMPGLTGLWQLSADRAFPIHENLHHDFAYIHHRDLSLDVAILVHTVFFAMGAGI